MARLAISVVAAVFVTAGLASCGNTIRGVGHDAANAINATQDAGKRVERAATR